MFFTNSGSSKYEVTTQKVIGTIGSSGKAKSKFSLGRFFGQSKISPDGQRAANDASVFEPLMRELIDTEELDIANSDIKRFTSDTEVHRSTMSNTTYDQDDIKEQIERLVQKLYENGFDVSVDAQGRPYLVDEDGVTHILPATPETWTQLSKMLRKANADAHRSYLDDSYRDIVNAIAELNLIARGFGYNTYVNDAYTRIIIDSPDGIQYSLPFSAAGAKQYMEFLKDLTKLDKNY